MPKCPTCNIPYEDHLGIEGTCKLYQEALREIDDLKRKISGQKSFLLGVYIGYSEDSPEWLFAKLMLNIYFD